MVVLTCRFHDHGTDKQYFHVPAFPGHNLAAEKGDQLAHVSLRPRCIKTMQAKKYSNHYQVMEMRGCYSGIDTADVNSRQHFDFLSHLMEEKECISLLYREDTRQLLRQLADKGVVSDDDYEELQKRCFEVFPDKSVCQECAASATYMTVNDCMTLHNELSQDKVIRYTARDADGRPIRDKVIPCWPRNLVWIHPNNKTGAEFPTLPQLKRSGDIEMGRLLWMTLGVMTRVPAMWKLLTGNVNGECVNVWLLSFASRKCFQTFVFKKTKDEFMESIQSLQDRLIRTVGSRLYFPKLLMDIFRYDSIKYLCIDGSENVGLSLRSLAGSKELVCGTCVVGTYLDNSMRLPDTFVTNTEH